MYQTHSKRSLRSSSKSQSRKRQGGSDLIDTEVNERDLSHLSFSRQPPRLNSAVREQLSKVLMPSPAACIASSVHVFKVSVPCYVSQQILTNLLTACVLFISCESCFLAHLMSCQTLASLSAQDSASSAVFTSCEDETASLHSSNNHPICLQHMLSFSLYRFFPMDLCYHCAD